MTEFLDGPAAGIKLTLKRAPAALRVVRTTDGEWDALDQLADTPRDGETVHVYQRVGKPDVVYLRCSSWSASGWYAMARYRHVPDAPPDPALRTKEAWRSWCMARRHELLAEASHAGD